MEANNNVNRLGAELVKTAKVFNVEPAISREIT
jgi:hypothetical protein